jgi:hypothetical protein
MKMKKVSIYPDQPAETESGQPLPQVKILASLLKSKVVSLYHN